MAAPAAERKGGDRLLRILEYVETDQCRSEDEGRAADRLSVHEWAALAAFRCCHRSGAHMCTRGERVLRRMPRVRNAACTRGT